MMGHRNEVDLESGLDSYPKIARYPSFLDFSQLLWELKNYLLFSPMTNDLSVSETHRRRGLPESIFKEIKYKFI